MTQLIVYGARCMWFDLIEKAATINGKPDGLPCCPFCKSVLMQIDEPKWWAGAKTHSLKVPGYYDMVRWAQGRCVSTVVDQRKGWEADGSPLFLETNDLVVYEKRGNGIVTTTAEAFGARLVEVRWDDGTITTYGPKGVRAKLKRRV